MNKKIALKGETLFMLVPFRAIKILKYDCIFTYITRSCDTRR